MKQIALACKYLFIFINLKHLQSLAANLSDKQYGVNYFYYLQNRIQKF